MKPTKTDNMDYWNHKVRYMPDLIATPLSYLFKVYPFGKMKIRLAINENEFCCNNNLYDILFL